MKPTDLRGILHYIPQFRDKVFIIAVDGAVVADDNFGNLMLDIAVLRSLNIQIVIVHGAGHQIRALAQELNVARSEEHTSELQSPCNLVCRLLLEKKKTKTRMKTRHLI